MTQAMLIYQLLTAVLTRVAWLLIMIYPLTKRQCYAAKTWYLMVTLIVISILLDTIFTVSTVYNVSRLGQ